MKKISNTIRIGVHRRENLSAEFNERQSPSLNVQEQANHQPVREQTNHQLEKEQANHHPVKEQQLSTQNSHDVSTKDSFHDQQQLSRLTSPNNVRVNDIDETNTNKEQQTKDVDSTLSTSNVDPQKQLLCDSNEIPIKTDWSTRKKVLVGFLVATIVGAIIIVAIVLPLVLTASGNTTTTSSSSSSTPTTTVAPTIISVYWPFDNILTDLSGVYTGTISNGGIFSVAGSLIVPYVGYGQALLLNGALSQQFSVPTPFLSLNSTSFTIEAWIYSTTLLGDRGIFGQCQCSTCENQCFFFICRSNRLYVGFTLNDLSGNTTMADTINNNVPAYQGRNGSIQIGSTEVYSATNYFTGYIDNVIVTTRAKSSVEILRDASVVVYYSFDLPNSNADSGPNHLNGTSNNTVTTNGRVNQAMRFTGFQSNFQVYGLYQVPYGVVNNKPFSVSMWINPTSTFSSTFVQTFASSLALGSCVNLLGIYSPAGVIGQLFVLSSTGGPSMITGPFVTQNTWSHVSVTYSTQNGYTLYYNGIYVGATGNTVYTNSITFAYLLIGYSTTCTSASINAGYQGSIDELYVHNRELTQSVVTGLANP